MTMPFAHHRAARLFYLCLGPLLLLAGCGQLNLDWGPLLYDVNVTPTLITPNADGDSDVTQFSYSLRRSATVSIYFTNAAGENYYFRQERRRASGDYRVQWGGTADEARIVETTYGPQEILGQVVPDGAYQWTITATDEAGRSESMTGTVTLQGGDAVVPELYNFAVVPQAFRPNQDGLRDDWVSISFSLTKDVDSLVVYLVDPADPTLKYYITQEPGLADPEDAGYKEYRYEGDVDKNAVPPPDGIYAVVAEARDRAGNAVRVTRELTITEGGKPFAEIDRGEINWYVMVGDERREEFNRTLSLNLGDKLCFSAIIHNYGVTPIRTAGPWPGQEYRFAENRNTVAVRHAQETVSAQLPKGDQSWLRQTGVWRFGINFESTGIDFPYRWAIGRQADLERRAMPGYGEQWYLLPGARGKVSGCIVIDQPPLLNTNLWWGGLIHEDVATVNNDIDRITVVVEAPSATNGLSAIAELSGTTALSATASLSATLPITTANTVTQAAP